MKQSPRPRVSSELSEEVDHKLTLYTLAASAAGVGLLALAQPAEAKIIYTQTRHVISPNHKYLLDLNHNGLADFTIQDLYGCNQDYCYDMLTALPAVGNAVEGAKGFLSIPYAYALKRGALIGPKQPFSGQLMASDNMGYLGQWLNVTDRYPGLKLQIKGKTHYGWARLSVSDRSPRIIATLTGYAYETTPNKAITAGQTKGPEETSVDEANPATLNEPTLRPASLGLLAMGSPALSIWRREESAPGSN